MTLPHISVCVCTFRRPDLLERLLNALMCQETGAAFEFSVVIADNDLDQSAKPLVSTFAVTAPVKVTYCHEPRQGNIALARNTALAHAKGEFIAFLDDDEFPEPHWLASMLDACVRFKAAGVLGPVRPHFEQTPPRWLVKGRFCERPEHKTGRVMPWEESRTGNLLFRRSIIAGLDLPFNPEFGTGGEDKDFFMRMTQQGHVFIWCNEAAAYETVPPTRWKRSYMLKRALLRGRNILKHPSGRLGILARSVVAVPVYTLILPPLLLLGHHIFMRYCVKLCDHLGRLLALVGINPVSERSG